MAVLNKADIASLTTQERLALINDLWESIESPHLEPSVEAAHRRVIEQRMADYDPSIEEFPTLDQVFERLHAR